ncbi:MAG: carboxypeptidase C (cathepsin A) [Planctomycetota bacterium]|jgi:carboxypeptidase C (cathepsin A)
MLLNSILNLVLATSLLLGGDEKSTESSAAQDDLVEQLSTTTHQATIRGVTFEYEASAGDLVLKNEAGEPKARFFYTSYKRLGLDDEARRPVTFCFNGGPGSSSVWLHLGVLGPKRVLMEDDGTAMAPPHKLIDNEYSILDSTDLVFIDPVTTGYSRPSTDEDKAQFHGRTNDVRWVAEFIRLYTTRHHLWESPKFLAGESYGTTRAAGLADELQSKHGMYLNGLMLISSILNFQTARFDTGNDLPFILFLPTYTATAWFHGKLDKELQGNLQSTLHEVEEFALGEYATALMLGDRLTADRRANIVRKLARYTGLSESYIESTNLRVNIGRFCKELRRDERKTTGRLDSRFTGYDRDAASDGYEYDPSYAAIQGSFSATLNHYLRDELGYKSDLPYEILTGKVWPWSYAENENSYVNVAESLRKAMTKNPHLKVYVANGYYDLATPYFATRYTFDHLGLEPHLRKNVSMGFFESGHMMYIHKPSLIEFHKQLETFLENSAAAPR